MAGPYSSVLKFLLALFALAAVASCGVGGGPATLTVTPSSGSVTGTLSYSSFDRCLGMRLSGSGSVTGTLLSTTQVDVLNFTFGAITFTATGQTFTMSGSASIDWASPASGIAAYVMTLNATVSGSSSFRLENFRVDSEIAAGIETLSISGRLTMTDGFVDITPRASPPRVELAVPSTTGLQNGGVVMTGATTVATVFFNGAAAPNISIAPR